MKLQIASHLAIYAILELAAQPTRHFSVAEISAKHNVSGHHLAKIMNALVRANMVRSVRGVGGGYQFVGNTRRITLLDVIRLFEDIGGRQMETGHSLVVTPAEAALRKILSEIDHITYAILGSTTIATMLKLAEKRQASQ